MTRRTPAHVPAQSGYFQTRLSHDERRARVWAHLTAYLARFIPPHASVLELGAGYCYFINGVTAQRKVAVDISAELLQWTASGVEGICSDAISYLREAAPAQFDFILASNFFEHFEWAQLDDMIGLIVRILRPGGRLAVIQPNFRLSAPRYFDDYTHRTIFTDVSMSDWLQSVGLTVARIEPRFLPLTVKSRLSALSFLIPLYLRLPFRPLAGQMFVLAEKGRAAPDD